MLLLFDRSRIFSCRSSFAIREQEVRLFLAISRVCQCRSFSRSNRLFLRFFSVCESLLVKLFILFLFLEFLTFCFFLLPFDFGAFLFHRVSLLAFSFVAFVGDSLFIYVFSLYTFLVPRFPYVLLLLAPFRFRRVSLSTR